MKRVLVIVVTYNGLPWLDRCLGSVTAATAASADAVTVPTAHPTAADGPESGTSTSKSAQNAADGPENGTSTAKTAQSVGGVPQTGTSPSKTAFFAGGGTKNGTPPTLDVYVVDNDSTDGSSDYIQSHFPGVKLVRAAENLGFSKANNLGMQYALDHWYDYVYLLNQDAWLEPGAMEKLVSTAEAHPEYAVLSPLQMTDGYMALDKQFAKLVPKGTLFQNRRFATPPTTWAPPSYDAEGGTDSGREYPPEPVSVKRVMAAHWLVSVKALKEVGLFNEDLFPFYGQDDNWCHRARHKGYKIGIVPEARAVHDRANRKEDKDRLIFRNYYTGSLVRLANPNVPMWLSYIYILAFTIVKAVKYRSLKVFTYFFRLHSQFPAIRTLRK